MLILFIFELPHRIDINVVRHSKINPFCPKCKLLLRSETDPKKRWLFHYCQKCNYGDAELIGNWLSTDDETNELFLAISRKLRSELDLKIQQALEYTEEFYNKFTDAEFCNLIGTNVKDEYFFHHEYFELLLYISYFVINAHSRLLIYKFFTFMLCTQKHIKHELLKKTLVVYDS